MAFGKDKRNSDLSVIKAYLTLRKAGLKPQIKDEKGYDIVLGDGRKVEVKFDSWISKTGNISCEYWVDEEKKTKGWIQYSDADLLVYFYTFDWAYALSMPKLKEYVRENMTSIPCKEYNSKLDGQAHLTRKTINLMLHISKIPHLRVRDIERLFRTPEQPIFISDVNMQKDIEALLESGSLNGTGYEK